MKIVNCEAHAEYQRLLNQEKELIFSSFSRADALELGLLMLEKAKTYPDPVAVEITINGLVVFRHFTDGSLRDSELWLQRKRNSVELMAMSSLRFMKWLEMSGEDLAGRKLDPADYAACGGGFPIALAGTGMIGSVCISGLPNHCDDHQIVVEALSALKARQAGN
jgi:uncharacterized protein (UPF0303 family)